MIETERKPDLKILSGERGYLGEREKGREEWRKERKKKKNEITAEPHWYSLTQGDKALRKDPYIFFKAPGNRWIVTSHHNWKYHWTVFTFY